MIHQFEITSHFRPTHSFCGVCYSLALQPFFFVSNVKGSAYAGSKEEDRRAESERLGENNRIS